MPLNGLTLHTTWWFAGNDALGLAPAASTLLHTAVGRTPVLCTNESGVCQGLGLV